MSVVGRAARPTEAFAKRSDSQYLSETLVRIVGLHDVVPRRVVVTRLAPAADAGHEFTLAMEDLISRWELWSANGWQPFTGSLFAERAFEPIRCVMPRRPEHEEIADG